MKSLTNAILKAVEGVFVAPVLYYRTLRYGYPFRRIKLTQPRYAVVDPEDYDDLRKYEWFTVRQRRRLYAARYTTGPDGRPFCLVRMHRQIMDVPPDLVVDHINHEGMDNRRANLRPATHAQNMRNQRKSARKTSSRYKGVSWHKYQQKWVANICVSPKKMFLGYFRDELEAAKAYDRAAKKYHGEFACLNFPE